MRVVYLRVSKGLPTEAEQRAAIVASSGATPEEMAEAWVDRQARKSKQGDPRFPERDRMLRSIHEGDEVWVARPGIIGASEPDILDFLAEMTEHGGVLHVASTGGRHRFVPGLEEVMRLVADIRADERAAVMAKARANVKRPAGKPRITPERLAAARALWFDHTIDGDEAAKRAGIGRRTLHRHFGPRETPPFGGRHQKRRR